jgi:hypothetical protein
MLFFFLPLFLIFLMIGLPVFFGMLAAPGSCSGSTARSATSRCLYRNVYTGMDSAFR